MSNRNHNYTNYSKANKPAEAVVTETPEKVTESPEVLETKAPESQSDKNTQNIQETPENTEPATNATPEPQTTQPEPEATKAVIGVVVNCEKLNIRETPFKTAEVLCIINKGEEIEVFEELSTDDFYAVSFGKDKSVSVEGYCMKQYIEINK